jgi:hypothetical protein
MYVVFVLNRMPEQKYSMFYTFISFANSHVPHNQ